MGADTERIQIANAIHVTAAITEARESGGLASIEAGKSAEIGKGQRSQAMAFGLLE